MTPRKETCGIRNKDRLRCGDIAIGIGRFFLHIEAIQLRSSKEYAGHDSLDGLRSAVGRAESRATTLDLADLCDKGRNVVILNAYVDRTNR